MDSISSMLPTEVVVKILQLVPQQPRFSACALVSRTWCTAAITATSRLVAQLSEQKQLDSLGLWLQRQGMRLISLSISSIPHQKGNYHTVLMAVPFQQLRQLKSLVLKSLALTNPSILHGPLLELTSLQLDNVHLHANSCVNLLSQLTSLRHLQLSNGHIANYHGTDFKVILQSGLGAWTQLTSLVLGHIPMSDDSGLKGLGNLSQLQQLKITNSITLGTGTLNSLPLSLRHLDIRVSNMQLGRTSELTCLQHLRIRCNNHGAHFEPKLLSNLVQLQHLSLHSCSMDDKTAVTTLLKILPQLQQLQHLSLEASLQESADAQQYTALISSTQLTCLDLMDCVIPPKAVYCVFSAAHLYPALQKFSIGLSGAFRHQYGVHGWAVCAAALDCLVSSCPNLKELSLINALDPGISDKIIALEQLTALSKLALSGDCVIDNSIAELIKLDLPTLRDLVISSMTNEGVRPSSHGVLQLRRMTQLTQLVLGCYTGLEDAYIDGEICLKFQSEAGLSDLPERMWHAFKDNRDMAKALLTVAYEERGNALERAEAAERRVQELQQKVESLETALRRQQEC